MTDEPLPEWIVARRETIKRHADEVCGQLRQRPVGSTGDDDEYVNFSDEADNDE